VRTENVTTRDAERNVKVGAFAPLSFVRL